MNESAMTAYVLPLLIGVVAGLRAMTAPAAVSIGAYLGQLSLANTTLAFLSSVWAAGILGLLAMAEFVTDQLPTTPSRKVPLQFGARLVSGGLSGAAIGLGRTAWPSGLIAGVDRRGDRHARRRGRSGRGWPPLRPRPPAAFIEDAVAIGWRGPAGRSLACDEPDLRRDHHRRRPGRAAARRPADRRRLAGSPGRTPSVRRHLREHRLHADQDAGRQRLRGPPRAARRRLRRHARRARRHRHGQRSSAGRRRSSTNARTSVETGCAPCRAAPSSQGHARFEAPTRSRRRRQLTAPRIFINVGGRAIVPDLPGIDDVPFLTNTSILELDRVPGIWSSSAAAISAWSSRRCTVASAREVTIVEKVAATDLARGRGRVGGGPGDPRGRRHRGPHRRRVHRLARHARRRRRLRRLHARRPVGDRRHVLLAVGRRPNTDDLGLDGPASRRRARLHRRRRQPATNVPGIWALGDCNGRGAFTHTAYNDFEIVAANLLDGATAGLNDRLPGYALYIDPPLGRVGHDRGRRRGARPPGPGRPRGR